MPKRSNRLIFCHWDDRDEGLLDWSRRGSRELEHFRELPPLWADAIGYPLRTVYTYGKRVRKIGQTRQGLRPNNIVKRTTSRYRPGRGGTAEFTLMKHAMAVFITCWEPYVAGVRTKALDALVPDPGPFRAAWMLYIHPSLAGTVTAPDVPVVERAPDGGLFLAATLKPFRVEEPEHVAMARRIAAAVAHLNVERPQGNPVFPPWPGHHSCNYFEARDRMWLGRSLLKIIPDQVLYPDETSSVIVGRVGPPDDAALDDVMAADPNPPPPWWAVNGGATPSARATR